MQPSRVDLTPFGFTPTESLVYEVLLTGGPGTGYAIARTAGLARANAYAALEGLVAKGAARSEEGRPKRYRPEPPSAVLARIMDRYGASLATLSEKLAEISVPASPTLVEVRTTRGILQLISHEVGRAQAEVTLLAPADAYPVLTPSLRRAATANLSLLLFCPTEVSLPFAEVRRASLGDGWPGQPVIMTVDGRSALLASREGDAVQGHWGTAPTLVAAARLVLGTLA
jgi:sugar-specific transcriptional regulator TrmB